MDTLFGYLDLSLTNRFGPSNLTNLGGIIADLNQVGNFATLGLFLSDSINDFELLFKELSLSFQLDNLLFAHQLSLLTQPEGIFEPVDHFDVVHLLGVNHVEISIFEIVLQIKTLTEV